MAKVKATQARLGKKEYDYDQLEAALSFSDRVSYATKKAADWRWLKNKSLAYLHYIPDNFGEDYVKRVQDSFLLLAGRPPVNWNHNPQKEATLRTMENALTKEDIPMKNTRMRYMDVLSPIIMNIQGDQQRRELNYIATDYSAHTRNYIKETQAKNILRFVDQAFIEPTRQMAMQELIQQQQITDLYALTAEQRAEMQAVVEEQVQANTPDDIMQLIRTGAQGIHEKQAQELVDLIVHTQDLKFKTDQGMYFSMATGGEVYKTDFIRGEPTFHGVDLENFYTQGQLAEFFIDRNDVFKETRRMFPGELWDRFAHELTSRSKLQQFTDVVNAHLGYGHSNTSNGRGDDIWGGQFMGTITTRDIQRMGRIDLRKEQGQRDYQRMMAKYIETRKAKADMVKVRDLVFKSRRKFYHVLTRKKTGNVVWEWHNEDYEFNPRNGDIKIREYWPPVYLKTTAIGELDEPMFLNNGRVEHQYASLDNPYDVVSPYTGAFFFRLNNEDYGDVVSPIDKAKDILQDIQVTYHRIREREATDIGKILLIMLNAKPKGWTWGKLLSVVRSTKMLPLATQKTGLSATDIQMIRQVDLGNTYEIIQRINYLQFQLERLAEILMSNKARQGIAPASTSVTNNMSNMQRSISMTSNIQVWHDEIVQRLAERLVHLGVKSVKSGNKYYRYALSNQTIANINLDAEIVAGLKIAIRLVPDVTEQDRVAITKNVITPLVARDGSASKALDIVLSKNIADLKTFAREADIQQEMRVQSEREFQLRMQTERMEAIKERDMFLQNFERELASERNLTNLEISRERADVLRRGNDVNMNMIPDNHEKEVEERKLEREKLAEEYRYQREELAQEYTLKMRELDLKEEEIKQRKS